MGLNKTYDLLPEEGAGKRLDENFYQGVVVLDASDDPFKAGRCKVFIRSLDQFRNTNNIKNPKNLSENQIDELPWVNPLLPKFLHMQPKKEQVVWVFVADRKNPSINRFYLGPHLSQPQEFKNNDFFSAKAGLDQTVYQFNKSIDKDPEFEIKGTNWTLLPKPDDIAILTRGNHDLTFRSKENAYDEILLRVSKYKENQPTKINKKNPGYISLTHLDRDSSPKLEDDRTHINLVSDNINLISHKEAITTKGGNIGYILTSDDPSKQLEIEEKLHPLVYGDKFWEFVRLVRSYITSHIHPERTLPPVEDSQASYSRLLSWIDNNLGNDPENSQFLSKGVKTN